MHIDLFQQSNQQNFILFCQQLNFLYKMIYQSEHFFPVCKLDITYLVLYQKCYF